MTVPGLQLLSIGRNRHIGFNEPGSVDTSHTRIVELRPTMRAANALQFSDAEVPTRAATIGIATILDAQSILLLATGEAKADALAAALEGAVSPAVLLSCHLDVTVLVNHAAASRLSPQATIPCSAGT